MATRILLNTAETERPVKVLRIQPYGGGGFAVLAPYHAARRGFVFKHAVDYSLKELLIPRSEVVEYSAADRVKLSLHPDGFVQFSGENPAKILSGREPATGEPKGLGLAMRHRLSVPIETGPTFALVVWGLQDFAVARAKDLEKAVVFSDRDFHNKDSYLRPAIPERSRENPYPTNAYAIEAFVLSRRALGHLRLGRPGESTVPLYHSGYQWRGGRIDLKVADLPGQPIVLGVMASRMENEWASDSGFSLHSPSDMRHALAAVYPAPQFEDPPADTLDWAGGR